MSENENQKNNGGFKLLAIRPIKGCDAQFRKNLKEGVVYKFYQDYKFLDSDGLEILESNGNLERDIVSVKAPDNKLDLYSDGDLKINISAVVGENGSGKSSLMELFYMALFLFDYKKLLKHQLLNIKFDFKFEDSDSFEAIITRYNEYLINNKKDDWFLYQLVEFKTKLFRFELFYGIIDEKLFSLNIDTSKVNVQNWSEFKSFNFDKESPKFIDFYTIGINYSLHSLNPNDLGSWVEQIFHKNDAYQTPLVLNPKREEKTGNIKIEQEKFLQKSRMLFNLIDLNDVQGTNEALLNSKKLRQINFSLDLFTLKFELPYLVSIPINKFQIYRNKSEITKGYEGENLLHMNQNILLFEIIENKYGIQYNELSQIEKVCFQYIAYKVCKAQETYPEIFPKTNLKEDFNYILNYDGHITQKIRQAINFIKKSSGIKDELSRAFSMYVEKYGKIQDEGFVLSRGNSEPAFPKLKFSIILEDGKDLKNQILADGYNSEKADPLDFLPPAFIDYDYQFSDNENDSFNNMSSGEKQQIYSVHTILYHMRNVLSVPENTELRKFNSINIFLDEIELYFHPEMQRQFVNNLVKAIKVLKKDKSFNVNILFSTHSPFILSDIPSNNILRLQDGKPSTEKFSETFGANIHDLLANDFFLKEGFMGEFAKEKINEVITYLNHEKLEREFEAIHGIDDKEALERRKIIQNQKDKLPEKPKSFTKLSDCLEIIKRIGEPALKNTLLHQYNTIVDFHTSSEHKWLEKLANELGYNLSKKR